VKVLICGKLADEGVDLLRKQPQIEVDTRGELSVEELCQIIGDVDGLIVRSDTLVTAEAIERGGRLRVVGRAGTGVDNIDVEAATRRGIVVMNAAASNTVTTAEHTLAMLLSLARYTPQANASLKNGRWERKRFLGIEISNKTLGIIGMGKIGSAVASRAIGLKMNVIAYDPFLTREAAARIGVELVSLDELYSRADFISIHTPLTPETRNLVGPSAFEKMRQGVRIINCARGGLIDEEALYNAIVSGRVAGAALDVFAQEPPPPNHPLLKLDQVICTPHLGASTQEAQIGVAVTIAEQMIDFLINGTVRGAVNVPSINADLLAEIQPYLTLGEKIASFHSQAFGEALREVNIEYSGEVTEFDVRPITQAILVGLLSPVIEGINFVNASIIAEERGIRVSELKSRKARDFADMITVRTVHDSKQSEVAGALFGRSQPRIVRINGFYLEAIPKGHMILLWNEDKPGVLGGITTYLGNNNINIGRLYLGRKEIGGTAIALIQVDTPLTPEIIAGLERLPKVISARQVKL